MQLLAVRFLNLLMAGLVAGTLLGISLGYNPKNLSALAYLEQQQNAIKSLNTLMPILGFITIVITLTSAFLQKSNKTIFIVLLVATAFLIISGLVTRLGNQPINSMVMNWGNADMPADWMSLRDKWWTFHIVRTITAVTAFGLIIWASLRRL